MDSCLLVERHGAIATLTLNRPAARNALNLELRRALARTFGELRDDARVVVLTGSGSAFCAGFDLAELSAGAVGGNAAEAGADISRELLPAIAAFPGPIIAAVNGPAVTAGFELALACDLIVASSEAAFADTHVRVGILPGWGLSQRLSRLVGIARAKELSFTGNFLSADQACRWGLVNRVVDPGDLVATALELAEQMLSANTATLAAYKKLIDDGFAMPFAQAMEHEAAVALKSAQQLTSGETRQRQDAVKQRGRRQLRGSD